MLQRRVDQPYERVCEALVTPTMLRAGLTLGFGSHGLFVLEAPFRPTPIPGEKALHAPAALTSSRGRRLALVRLAITESTADACTLSLHPLSSRTDRWSPRRVEQYFDLARAGLDSIVGTIDEEVAPTYSATRYESPTST